MIYINIVTRNHSFSYFNKCSEAKKQIILDKFINT